MAVPSPIRVAVVRALAWFRSARRSVLHVALVPFRQHESGPVYLWWEALMLYVPLNLLGLVLLPLTPFQRRFQVGYFLVFVVANYVIFQPWELDNTKVR
jgi:hypothetical protein